MCGKLDQNITEPKKSYCGVETANLTKLWQNQRVKVCRQVWYSGFLLGFVKGGNKFVIAGGYHLVNVSQRIMGTRWPQEEWKPNMV